MAKKKWVRFLMRLFCSLIDYLLLLVPTQLVMLYWMGVPENSADFLFRLLYAVYGTLMVEYNHGATIGKRIGRLRVADRAGGKPAVLYVGLRELVKAMYLIPFIGWRAGLVSIVLFFVRDTTLHDMVGGTKVVFQWEYEPPEE